MIRVRHSRKEKKIATAIFLSNLIGQWEPIDETATRKSRDEYFQRSIHEN